MSHHDEHVLKCKIDLILARLELLEGRLFGADAVEIKHITMKLRASEIALKAVTAAAESAGAGAAGPPNPPNP